MKRPRIKLHSLENRMGNFLPLTVGVIGLVFIMFGSTFGYMYLEGWDFWDSFYMAMITLSTVGFQEVHELSRGGRLFTSVIIFIGVGAFMFFAGAIAQIVVEGRLHYILGRKRMQHKIDHLKNHFIVCGYGRIGSIVAKEIKGEGLPVVVIEQNEDLIMQLEDEDMLHVQGDATSDEVLMSAGLERARSLVTTLDREASNVYVILTARQVKSDILIIARCDNSNHIHRLELAGADRVVMPHTIGGIRMAQSVLRPTVISFLELAMQGGIDLQLAEMKVKEGSELVSKDLIQSQIRPRFNLIIVGIKQSNGEMLYNPPPQTVIEAGVTLLAIGKKDNLRQLEQIL